MFTHETSLRSASTNPRTSQRALLVASELARLIPEGVLHNVMPIFTFMGASDFQRDDAYSFGVVEKVSTPTPTISAVAHAGDRGETGETLISVTQTVERIVPVMTRSLKDKSADELGLYKESAGFLGIFTDMVGRLPKHRTLP
jgi:U3 small nucleolar RNA-associated protein 10